MRTTPSITALPFLLLAAALCGCGRFGEPREIVAPPDRHSVRVGNLVVRSDAPLPDDHPLVADLDRLRNEVVATLALPEPTRDVVVYLFPDEPTYRRFLDAVYPGLPARRAYFVSTGTELSVYTCWGDRVAEDLRHEATHGVLHAALGTVPLWLDEGLAEYFETPAPGGPNADHLPLIAAGLADGTLPSLDELESLGEFRAMGSREYAAAWGWTHFLLTGPPAGRDVLLGYLAELPAPGDSLSSRVTAELPATPQRFAAHAATLGGRY